MKKSKDSGTSNEADTFNTTTTPHDSFLYDVLGRPEVRKDFCQHNLPAILSSNINYSTLRRVENTYVDKSLRKYASDIVLECELNPPKGWTGEPQKLEILLLIEHQSTPDEFMPFRIFHYIFGKLNEELKEKRPKKQKLTPIYPVIFYNGKRTPYPYTKSLYQCFLDPYKIMEMVFNQDVEVIDVNQLDIDELKKQRLIGLVSRAMRYKNEKQNKVEYLSNLILDLYCELSCIDKDSDFAQVLLTYIVNIAEFTELKAAIEHNEEISKHMEKDYMTAAEFFTNQGKAEGKAEGIAKGKAEGIAKGKAEEKIEVAKNGLRKGYETQMLADLTGLDVKIIEQLKADLANEID